MNPYLALFMADVRRKSSGPSKPVVHRETCPICGRQRVNLYRKGNEWKCRRCWEEAAT